MADLSSVMQREKAGSNSTSGFRLFPYKIIGVPFCLFCGVDLAVAHGWALGLGYTHHHV